MNEILREKWIQAQDDVVTAKRRFVEATARHLQPQQSIEDYRKAHAAEHSRRVAEQLTVRLRWEEQARELAAEKRQREARYIEEQQKVKREFEEAETVLAHAQRAFVRIERELTEDAENTRLKQERAAAKAQREAEQEVFNEGRRAQKQIERELKERHV